MQGSWALELELILGPTHNARDYSTMPTFPALVLSSVKWSPGPHVAGQLEWESGCVLPGAGQVPGKEAAVRGCRW